MTTTADSLTNTNVTLKCKDNSSQPERFHIIGSCIIVWLDPYMNGLDDDTTNAIIQLRHVVHSTETFNDLDQCVDFVTDIKYQHIFMIISDSIDHQIISLIEDISQIYSIYIYVNRQMKCQQWTDKDKKLKGIFTRMDSICAVLERDVRQSDISTIPISIVSNNDDLDKLDQSFMYSQILKETICEIEYNESAKKCFVDVCNEQYAGNNAMLEKIKDFDDKYNRTSSIWWYTKESFIYSTLNKALRTQDIETIIRMAFILRDIHREIERLHSQMNWTGKMTVYRGQGLSKFDFEKLQDSRGGLLSFNNFLSTSQDPTVSYTFAESIKSDPKLIGIWFKIEIDTTLSSIPFASLDSITYFDSEREILFSMHSVFRIRELKQIGDRLWEVDLILTSDNDEQLKQLTNYIIEEIGDTPGWLRMCRLIELMGQFDKTMEIANALIEMIRKNDTNEPSTSDTTYHNRSLPSNLMQDFKTDLSDCDKAREMKQRSFLFNRQILYNAYNLLGVAHNGIGDFKNALVYCQQALDIQEKHFPDNYSSTISIYNNIGVTYRLMGDYPSAKTYYEQVLNIQQRFSLDNHQHSRAVYNNLSILNNFMGDFQSALSWSEKGLEVSIKTLPLNHPGLADSYLSLGMAHFSMQQYKDAVSYIEKALEIQTGTLPPNHLRIGITCNNLGLQYISMKDYQKALPYLEKALEIYGNSLKPNYLELAHTCGNIGAAYHLKGDYKTAISYYEKGMKIKQKYLSSNHKDFIATYANLGSVHKSIEDYSTALCYFEKTLEILKMFAPSHSRLLFMISSEIASLYELIGNYKTAVSVYENLQLNLSQSPSNYEALIHIFNQLSKLYYLMGDNTAAHSCIKKCLTICHSSGETVLPGLTQDHHNLISVFDETIDESTRADRATKALKATIESFTPDDPRLLIFCKQYADAVQKFGQQEDASELYQIVLRIQLASLPPDHPDVATTCTKLGEVYRLMGKYSISLSYYEKALEIRQRCFPSNHPMLVTAYKNAAEMHRSMEDYTTALSYYEKVLQMQEKSLSLNQPDLVETYNNIGQLYQLNGNYCNALRQYEKVIEIRQTFSPPNYLELAATFTNIGEVHRLKGNDLTALSYLDKSLGIQEKSLLLYPVELGVTHYNMGTVYLSLKEYSTALPHCKKALGIWQNCLSTNHPFFTIIYRVMAKILISLRRYDEAMGCLTQGLDITKQAFENGKYRDGCPSKSVGKTLRLRSIY